MGKEHVISFYRKSWPLIVKLLQVDKTYCIHHGYYEKGIRTHVQSVLKMNDVIGSLLHLETPGGHIKKVLDAGCGIGGTVIHLAKRYPSVAFVGITILPEHIKTAQRLAHDHQVDGSTEFLLADFMDTGFSPSMFDAVYLIESACYAPNKHLLLHELYRILKPGGTLVVIDCFRTSVQVNPLLNTFYNGFCRSWGLPPLIVLDDFKGLLHAEGFHNITARDLSKNVMRSIIREDVLSSPYLISLLLRRMMQGKHYRAEDDSQILALASISSSLMGLKKAITYQAVIAEK